MKLIPILLLTALPLSAQQRVLIPIFTGGPGAYGAQWVTRLTIANTSSEPLKSIPYVLDCPIPEGCSIPFPPHFTTAVDAATPSGVPTGFFLDLPAEDVPRVLLALRVFDRNSAATDYGSTIPVVSTSAFTESEINLLDVPVDGAYRVAIRIYAQGDVTPDVVLRLWSDPLPSFATPATQLVAERVVTLAPAPHVGVSAAQPSYAFVSDLIPPGLDAERNRDHITVQSRTPGVPVWAFASVTNNATQRITTIAPAEQLH